MECSEKQFFLAAIAQMETAPDFQAAEQEANFQRARHATQYQTRRIIDAAAHHAGGWQIRSWRF